MSEANVTHHAHKRIRERVGLPKCAAQKTAQRALTDGVRREDTHGSLRRYLDALYHYNEQCDSIRVWAEKVYIFAGHTLVTVLDLPQRYKNRANGMARKGDNADGEN